MTDQAHTRPVVLVVDDEVLVRMLAVDVLEEAGFVVLEAENAEAALLALRARPDIAVLLTDVDMPGGMNGFDLARLTRERHPGLGIVIISGKSYPRPGELPPGAHFIGKPYRPEAVVELVQQLADHV